ncbi:MAG: phosphoadenylyl-sulfate reductase [Verrucomicrobiae bacterium]|nr:phosphoadenylyl-sulfate reductase [Verrucomicrobiae bacterium]MDW8344920.1 phosphoadenylyl-sulfate reductase [Verrucomicrobiae bacterium]
MKFSPDQIRELSAQFEGQHPRQILQWAADQFMPRLAISTAFGPEGLVILDIAMRKVTPRIPVFTIDTGFLFPETQELITKIEKDYGITVERLHPDLTPEQQAAQYGPELYRREPDKCCHLRKVLPLQKKLPQLDAMITGLRRTQSATRANAAVLQLQQTPDGYRYLKINPLVGWSKEEVWWYIVSHQLHYNPLHDRGYASIGCTPDCCTRPVQPGEDERAGRWAGTDKKECGLHTFAANI